MSTTFFIREIHNGSGENVTVTIGTESSTFSPSGLRTSLPDDCRILGFEACPGPGRNVLLFPVVEKEQGNIVEVDGATGEVLRTHARAFVPPAGSLPFDVTDEGGRTEMALIDGSGRLLWMDLEGGRKTLELPAEIAAEEIGFLRCAGGAAFLLARGKGIWELDLAALQSGENSGAIRRFHRLEATVTAMNIHCGALYIATTEGLLRMDLETGHLRTVLRGFSGDRSCLAIQGMMRRVRDQSDDRLYSGDYLFLMLKDGGGHGGLDVVLAPESREPKAISLGNPTGATSPDISGLAVNYETGTLFIHNTGFLWNRDATEGVPFLLKPNERQLLANNVPVPFSPSLPVTLNSHLTGLYVEEAGEDYCFWAGVAGDYHEVSLHGDISENAENLLRMELGLNDGGDVIISILDIDPGKVHQERFGQEEYSR